MQRFFAGQRRRFRDRGNKGYRAGHCPPVLRKKVASVAIAAIDADTPPTAAGPWRLETGATVLGHRPGCDRRRRNPKPPYAQAEDTFGRAFSLGQERGRLITIARIETLTEREWDMKP